MTLSLDGMSIEIVTDEQLLKVVRIALENLVRAKAIDRTAERRVVLPLLDVLQERLEPVEVGCGR